MKQLDDLGFSWIGAGTRGRSTNSTKAKSDKKTALTSIIEVRAKNVSSEFGFV